MSVMGALFSHHKTYTATIYHKSQTITNGVPGAITYTPVASATCLYYSGSTSKRLVSEQLLPSIEGVLLFKPGDLAANTVTSDGRIDISDIPAYGYVNHTGGYSTGAFTIAVDGFNESRRMLQKNDTFTVEGETGTPVHTITATTRTSLSTTSITFTTALASNIDDDATVTVTPVLYRLSPVVADNIGLQDQVFMVPVKAFK